MLSSSSFPSLDTASGASTASAAQPDRLARSCDTCFTSVFAPTTPASRFLAPRTVGADRQVSTGAGTGSVRWTGTWRLSKALGPAAGGLEPLWDLDELAGGSAQGKENEPAAVATHAETRRARRRSAVGQLKALMRE